ncbi:MAG: ring-cleaving dioxygenase [Pseudomonadota bacterium]
MDTPTLDTPANKVAGNPVESPVKGLHHVTAIASNPQANLDFYSRTLGLRFVKKTVNFDDPGTYHLYYGDAVGHPGTVMTFFPWMDLPRGGGGTGEVGVTQFAVPEGSLDFWRHRIDQSPGRVLAEGVGFGERHVLAEDPDGLTFSMAERPTDARTPWMAADVGAEAAVRGFNGVTLTLADRTATGELLTGLMGYEEVGTQGNLTRYRSLNTEDAGIVDIIEDPQGRHARQGAGRVHHVAFNVDDRAAQLVLRNRLIESGFQVTPVIDRNYFFAIYFRTPGGVLFEVATNEPGFTADEAEDMLGQSLKLPAQHEPLRQRIEEVLPPLTLSS